MKHLYSSILLNAVATGGTMFAEVIQGYYWRYFNCYGEGGWGALTGKETRRTEETRLFNRF